MISKQPKDRVEQIDVDKGTVLLVLCCCCPTGIALHVGKSTVEKTVDAR